MIICLSFLLKGFIPSVLTGVETSPRNFAVLNILRDHYGNGEINKAGFETRKKDVRG